MSPKDLNKNTGSYKFVAATTPRLLHRLPYRAFFENRPVAVTLGFTFQSLTHISYVHQTLLDERMWLYEIPCLCSRDLFALGLPTWVVPPGSVYNASIREWLYVVVIVLGILVLQG
jgi:hypothetical protein